MLSGARPAGTADPRRFAEIDSRTSLRAAPGLAIALGARSPIDQAKAAGGDLGGKARP
jgi:hypothetical protein